MGLLGTIKSKIKKEEKPKVTEEPAYEEPALTEPEPIPEEVPTSYDQGLQLQEQASQQMMGQVQPAPIASDAEIKSKLEVIDSKLEVLKEKLEKLNQTITIINAKLE